MLCRKIIIPLFKLNYNIFLYLFKGGFNSKAPLTPCRARFTAQVYVVLKLSAVSNARILKPFKCLAKSVVPAAEIDCTTDFQCPRQFSKHPPIAVHKAVLFKTRFEGLKIRHRKVEEQMFAKIFELAKKQRKSVSFAAVVFSEAHA